MSNFKILSPNMYTNQNINEWTKYVNINKNTRKAIINKPCINISNNEKICSEIFHPNQNDKLFWCLYVIINSLDDYNKNINRLFSIEKKFKYDSIDVLRKQKTLLKDNKIKINEIENNLVSENKISLPVFYSFCIIYQKSVIIKNAEIYYDINFGDKYHLIEINNKNIKLHLGNISNLIENIKNNNYCLEINKPIKNISFYKISDLQNIAKKLNIQIIKDNKKLKKQDLYELILFKIKKLT